MEANPHKIFQQSVTMTAKMWPQVNNTMTQGAWEWGWRVPPQHWPLLVAAFCGGALVLLIIITAILWYCCVASHRNKDYRVKMEGDTLRHRNVIPVLPSHSAVFVEPKCGDWSYNSCLVSGVGNHWFYNKKLSALTHGVGGGGGSAVMSNVPRSLSVPGRRQSSPSPSPSAHVVFPPDTGPASFPFPHISEFSPGAHHLSSSILDECGSRELYPCVGGVMLKTQSLPACVRNRPRPVSSGDDLAELYAKVNFSKKRKNRMRNDEAAIIALSKSRSQYLHKDTDALVDNEAVIVYDERTAL